MPTVTLPPTGARPEHYEALQALCRAGLEPARIIRVYGAGDELAEPSILGYPCDTILWVGHDNSAWTTIYDGDGMESWPGWGPPAPPAEG